MSADQSISERLAAAYEMGLDILQELGDNVRTTLRDRRERYEFDVAAAGLKEGLRQVDRNAPTRAITRAVQTYGKFLSQMRMDDILRQKLALDGRVLDTLTDAQYQQEMQVLANEAIPMVGNDVLLKELDRRGLGPKVVGMLSPGAQKPEDDL